MKYRGCRLLNRYISKAGYTYRELAELLGISHVSLYHWANNDMRPKSISHRIFIEDITNGFVPVSSWDSDLERIMRKKINKRRKQCRRK